MKSLLVLFLTVYGTWAHFADENDLEHKKELLRDTSTTAELVELICSCKDEDIYHKPTDCYDIMIRGGKTSGRYHIYPHDDGTPQDPLFVWCDMDTDDGGWTVLQKRQDGSVNFDLEWDDYKAGFGHIGGEYWLGNQHIYVISNQKEYELRVEVEEYDGTKHVNTYDHFRLGAESTHYTLFTGTYTGKQDVCISPLGMESGDITDGYISATSEESDAALKADLGRLKSTTGSWVPKIQVVGQYFQVYFHISNIRLVSGIIMQGRHNAAHWITKFRIYYNDGIAWQYILDPIDQDIMEFQGSVNQNSLKTVYFDYPIKVYHIRLYPTEWRTGIGLRLELLGCGGNFLAYQNNRKFSTKDADNDAEKASSCAEKRGAWWYGDRCQESDLNYTYMKGAGDTNRGISWRNFDRVFFPLKRTEMKIRPVGHVNE